MKVYAGLCSLFILKVAVLAVVDSQNTGAGISNDTCNTATVSCLTAVTSSNTDSCGIMSNRLNCFSGTRSSNCTVNETMVTFEHFLPVFTDICQAVVNYSSSCLDYVFCLLETDYSTMVSSVNYTIGPSEQQISNFTNTDFWCTYTHQTIDCFLRNNESCEFPEYAQAAIRAHKGWLTETCTLRQGSDNSVSSRCQSAVASCLTQHSLQNRECKEQSEELNCLSETRRQCDVNETVTTFDALSDVLADVCTVVNPYVEPCFSLSECLATTDYALTPGLDSPSGPPPVVYDQLLNTQFWCRYLEQTINCFLAKATVCAVPLERVQTFDATVDLLRAACAGDKGRAGGWNYNGGTTATTTASNVILLLAARYIVSF